MLYAIDRHRDSLLWQSHLRRLLGVTAATISRMVRSLEALGYITRARNDYDRRQINIRITELGTRVFAFVEDLTMTSGYVDFIVTCTFGVLWYAESAISDLLDFRSVPPSRLATASGHRHTSLSRGTPTTATRFADVTREPETAPRAPNTSAI